MGLKVQIGSKFSFTHLIWPKCNGHFEANFSIDDIFFAKCYSISGFACHWVFMSKAVKELEFCHIYFMKPSKRVEAHKIRCPRRPSTAFILEIMDVFCNFVFPAWCLCCKRNVKIWSCYSNQLFINPPEPWDLQRQLEAPGAPALCWSTPTNRICTLDFLEVWWLMTHTHLGLFLKNPMLFFYSFPTASLSIIKDETLKMLLTHQPVSKKVKKKKRKWKWKKIAHLPAGFQDLAPSSSSTSKRQQLEPSQSKS